MLDVETLATFYGADVDELHLAFNFVFLLSDFSVAALAPVVAETEARLPEHAWPVWTLGNHDITRYPTRWGGGDARAGALRADAAHDPARHAGRLLRRRAGDARDLHPARPRRRPRGPPRHRPRRPRRRSHADAVARRAGPGLHAVRRRAVAALRRRALASTSTPSARTATRRCGCATTSSRCAARSRTCGRARMPRSAPPTRSGCIAAARPSWWRSTSATPMPPCRFGDRRRRHSRARDGEAVEGTLALGPRGRGRAASERPRALAPLRGRWQ